MNGSKRVYMGLWGLALPCLLAGSGAIGADDEGTFDRTPRDCVLTRNIARTDIVDDQTILFYMRGKDVAYRNYLPKKCPGLKRADRFSYQVTAGRLCSVDLITVLELGVMPGRPFERGFTCRLGDFHPLSPEDIESLKVEKQGGPRPDSVRTKPADVPPAESADSAAVPAAPQE